MSRVVCCSLSAAGAKVAALLPYEHRHGEMIATVEELWGQVEGLVLVGAAGIAVRAVSPHLRDKSRDPAVVCIDDAARFAVALAGGHAAGANRLAREVAALTGATPVVSTATDEAELPSLDTLPGLSAEGDLATVTRRWLDGHPPGLRREAGLETWPLPQSLLAATGYSGGATSVVLTDKVRRPAPGEVLLRPRSLVLGVGASSGTDLQGLIDLAGATLEAAGLDPRSVGTVATLDRKVSEPAVGALARHLGAELRGFPDHLLARVRVPNPSEVVRRAVGTPSVAEAAALLAAGPGSALLVPKAISTTRDSTLAVVRRGAPEGHLAVVGLGPGDPRQRTPEAAAMVRHADVLLGYESYVEMAADLIEPRHEVHRFPIGAEERRCRMALELAARGRRVALVCSGDPGVYAMASLVCELAPDYGDPPVSVVPGVTAALAGAALLGAPLGHDHAAISLSDLLTPWEVIAKRLEAAGAGDFVVSLYNPRSSRRVAQLEEALRILGRHRPPGTPAAVLTNVGRPGGSVLKTTLSEMDPSTVGMLSLVLIGSSSTRWVAGRMITPRGYEGTTQ